MGQSGVGKRENQSKKQFNLPKLAIFLKFKANFQS